MRQSLSFIILAMLLLPLAVAAQDSLRFYASPTAAPRENAETTIPTQRNSLQREQEMVILKDRIKQQHKQIIKQCDEEGVADKDRKIFLHDIKLKYRKLYQIYHIESNDDSDEYFALLKQCDSMQRHLSDSIIGRDVLGTDSYPFQIENFKNTLKFKAGNDQREVYKSYLRSYKPPSVAITFNTLAEYRQYVQRLLEIIQTQNYYLEALDWCRRIEANTGSILAMLGNTGHANPYKDIVRNTSFMPDFTTVEGGQLFIEKLKDFESIQQEYLKTDASIRELEQISDTIKRVGRKYSDLTGAFNIVRQGANVYPAFRNRYELEAYWKNMNDYKTVYLQYLALVYLRDSIRNNEEFLKRSTLYRQTMKRSLNILSDGQRTLRGHYTWTPSFSTPDEGKKFFDEMHRLLEMQQHCMAIYDNIVMQELYEKEILELTKKYSYIRRGYNAMIDSYYYKGSIATQENLRIFDDLQTMTVKMQEKLIEYINRNPRELELQMRNAKNVHDYKALIGVK